MLDDKLAQKLIDKLSGTMHYNVNVMDTTGTIIASYDTSRIGTFHETAYRMIKERTPIVEVHENEKLVGTRPGINMILENKKEVIGIVGITGDPDTLRPMALLFKAAIESLLEFELQQQALMKRTNKKDRFFQQMIYREDRSASDLYTLATELGYRTDAMRIAIYIDLETEETFEEVAAVCKGNRMHKKDDMLIRTESGNILIFYSLKERATEADGYRNETELYLDDAMHYMKKRRMKHRVYVGSMQNELMMYREAYLHSRYLKTVGSANGSILYFYDYLDEYFQSKVPFLTKRNALESYISQRDEKFWEMFRMVVGTMMLYNNNMVKASEALHMHKNTLVYKYNQIRETLQINPIENAKDNQLARQLCYYLSQR